MAETGSICYLAPIVLCVQPGCEDIAVKKNILYRTWEPDPLVSYGYIEGHDCVDFSGNTYVQNLYGYSVWLWRCGKNADNVVTADYEWSRNEIGQNAEDVLGDSKSNFGENKGDPGQEAKIRDKKP